MSKVHDALRRAEQVYVPTGVQQPATQISPKPVSERMVLDRAEQMLLADHYDPALALKNPELEQIAIAIARNRQAIGLCLKYGLNLFDLTAQHSKNNRTHAAQA